MKENKKLIKCPVCDGSGQRRVGQSVAMQRAIDHGYPSTYECECCFGTGKITEGTNPDWWRPSDLGGR